MCATLPFLMDFWIWYKLHESLNFNPRFLGLIKDDGWLAQMLNVARVLLAFLYTESKEAFGDFGKTKIKSSTTRHTKV